MQILAVENADRREHANDHVTVQRGEAADERLGLGHLELQVVDQKADAAGVLGAREEHNVPVALQALARLFAAAVRVLQTDDAAVAVPRDPEHRVVLLREQRHHGWGGVGVVVEADEHVVPVQLVLDVFLVVGHGVEAALAKGVLAHVNGLVPQLPALVAQGL